MKLGEKIRALIEERELTQKALANALNIAPSTLGGYVQGISEPDYDTLKKIATYFSVSTDYLLDHNIPTKPITNEGEFLRIISCLTEAEREVYLEQGKAFIKIKNKKV